MNINRLIKEAHDNAIEKGFYECPECLGKGKVNCGCSEEPDIMECPECNGTRIDQNKNIPGMLMLVITEISEAVEALRKNKHADYNEDAVVETYTNCSTWFEEHYKDTFEDEIADVFIRLFDLCGYMNIDIEKHIKAKMEYNKTRPKKHNKEF